MKGLTSKQEHVLELLKTHQKHYGFPPTNKELADMLGSASPNSANTHLKALERKGVITLRPGVARGITINAISNEDQAISLIKSLVEGEEYAREHAIAFLESRGVQV